MTTDLLVRPVTGFPALAQLDLQYPWPATATGLTAALPAPKRDQPTDGGDRRRVG